MRRNTGIAVVMCLALAEAAAVDAVGWASAGNEDGSVGARGDTVSLGQAPVTGQQKAAGVSPPNVPVPTAPSTSQPTTATPAPAPAPTLEPSMAGRQPIAESATTAGRQKIGELLPVNKLLSYFGAAPPEEVFSYPGASYVKLHFDRFALLPGDYVSVSNPDGTESYRYDSPDLGNIGVVSKWAMSVSGDTAVLRIHQADGVPRGRALRRDLGVSVDQVARGFSRSRPQARPQVQPTMPGRAGQEESVCGSDTTRNAVCYRSSDPVAYTKSKAIARLLINGTELCTGWRFRPQTAC